MSEAIHNKKRYSFEEWLEFAEDRKTELYDGIIVMMAEPSREHQMVSLNLTLQIGNFLKGKPCVLFSPWAVKLFANHDKAYVPDLLVVCDNSKIGGSYVNGAPDFIIEILSPSTSKNDRYIKFADYERAGVKEYWIVDILVQTIQVNLLQGEKYTTYIYSWPDDSQTPVSVLPGLEIDLNGIFTEL